MYSYHFVGSGWFLGRLFLFVLRSSLLLDFGSVGWLLFMTVLVISSWVMF